MPIFRVSLSYCAEIEAETADEARRKAEATSVDELCDGPTVSVVEISVGVEPVWPVTRQGFRSEHALRSQVDEEAYPILSTLNDRLRATQEPA